MFCIAVKKKKRGYPKCHAVCLKQFLYRFKSNLTKITFHSIIEGMQMKICFVRREKLILSSTVLLRVSLSFLMCIPSVLLSHVTFSCDRRP